MSGNGKQKTLFQTWKHKEEPTSSGLSHRNLSLRTQKKKCEAKSAKTCGNDVIEISEDDLNDDDLLSATVAIEHSANEEQHDICDLSGFDKFSGNLWIYPTNYPVREYQHSIVKSALFNNTLVALPTGLGKTFIAAVVLYNFYRWYPQGKVVFMAPTKPLVSQQIDACYKIMGIPMEDQAQITGSSMPSSKRAQLWSTKRVFFLTPQVINNDLMRGVCPGHLIKCLVIDEAHKALGNHAYCQVVQQLLAYTRNFRVLALSATPGSDLKSVQQVVRNLLISCIELRSDDAIDIKQYMHTRSVDKIVVKLNQQIIKMKEKYLSVIQMFINNLVNNKAIYNKDVSYLSKYALLMARDQFRKDPPSGLSRATMGTLEGTFAISISLYHGLELLLQHGMKSFFIFLKGIMEGGKGNMRSKATLHANPQFRSIYEELIGLYGSKPKSVILFTQGSGTQHAKKQPIKENVDPDKPVIYSHPKMRRLEEVMLNHFRVASTDKEHETRVMVFCQYRDIVREVTELLQQHRPLIRPMQFVGHAPSTNPNDEEKSSKSSRFTQKDQLMVVNKFRCGDYNTLVSTCVGEEGLDIGDVDLIICFDSHKSPIRLVQRMGRTGRKRKGRIVMLVTEGKEERDYNSSLASRRSIQKAIYGAAGKTIQYYTHSPAMVPKGIKPHCHKMFITVADKPTEEKKKSKIKEIKSSSADISVMLRKNSIFLNQHEKDSWKSNLMLSPSDQDQLKTLPKAGKCLIIENELWGETSFQSSTLSLSEWLPWQCRLQQTRLVEHSCKTKMFSEILELCDIIKEADDNKFDNELASLCGATHNATSPYKALTVNFIDKFLVSDAAGRVTKLKRNTTGKIINFKHQNNELNLDKNVRKCKSNIQKELVIISDDDDFHHNELPSFHVIGSESCEADDKLHDYDGMIAGGQSSSLKASLKATSIEGGGCTSTPQNQVLNCSSNKNDVSAVTSASEDALSKLSRSVLKNHASFSIAANISALCVTPIQYEDQTIKKVKASKPVITPPVMDSIVFDFPAVFHNSNRTSHQSREKLSCFKLFDFDENNELINDEDDANEVCEDVQSGERNCDFEIPFSQITRPNNKTSTQQHVLGECLNRNQEEPTENDDVYKQKPLWVSELFVISSIKKLQDAPPSKDVSAHDEVHVLSGDHKSMGNKIGQNITEKEFLFPNDIGNSDKNNATTPAQMPLLKHLYVATESFDMSADMFSPQFDLDFDLGCDTPIKNKPNDVDHACRIKTDVDRSTKAEVNSNILKSELKLSCASNITSSNVSSVGKDASVHELQSVAREEENIRRSPASTSFGLSQTKRLKNQVLFAELDSSGRDIHIPFAKVLPQRCSPIHQDNDNLSDASLAHTSMIRNGVGKQRSMKNLKRRRIQSHATSDELSHTNMSDDDDFQTSSTLNKRRRIVKLIQSDAEESEHSPIILCKQRHKVAVLSSDSTLCSDVETMFQHECEEEDFSLPMFDLEEKSPILSGKQPHDLHSSRTESPCARVALHRARFNMEHSTPKSSHIAANNEESFVTCDRDPSVVPISKKKTRRKRTYDVKTNFICDEAEVSVDEEVSSDEDHDDVTDEEMMKFVNDASQLTQHVGDNSTRPNEQAMYLQSVKNFLNDSKNRADTEALSGRYKLNYNVGNNMDVFSQVPDKDLSDYMEDSFCVMGDVDEDMDHGEITIVQSTSFDNNESYKRPRTRRQAKFEKHASKNITKKKNKTGRKRIIICDENSDESDEGDDDVDEARNKRFQITSSIQWQCGSCTLYNPSSASICNACSKPDHLNDKNLQIAQTSLERFCEVCGSVLTTNGWMCKQCIAVMKSSEKYKPETRIDMLQKTKNREDEAINPQSETENQQTLHSYKSPTSIDMKREERLKRSRQKQMELRAMINMKKSILDQSNVSNASSPHFSSPTNERTNKQLSFHEISSSNLCAESINHENKSMNAEPSKLIRNKGKLVILLDSKEVNGGSMQLIQQLRTHHDMITIIASMQYCSYIVGKRCAVIRKTKEDIAMMSKKQKLFALIKQANPCFDKLYLIVEKDRVKSGLLNNKPSSVQVSNYTSNIVAISQENVEVLYSNNQEQTAGLLHMLTSRERHGGQCIDLDVVQGSDRHQHMTNMYTTIPGISYINALYLCYNYKSLNEVLKSSLDDLVAKACLTHEASENLHWFLKKKFDIQMTPL